MCAVIEITTTFMRNKNISSHQKYFSLAGQTIVWITVGYEIFQHVSECKRDGLLCCYFFGKQNTNLHVQVRLFLHLYALWLVIALFSGNFTKKKTFTNLISNHKLIPWPIFLITFNQMKKFWKQEIKPFVDGSIVTILVDDRFVS